MLTKNKTMLMLAVAMLAAANISPANAAVILSTDFAGASKVGPVATISSWDTEDGITASTSFNAVNEAGNPVGYSSVQPSALDVATSVWSPTDGWDVSFTTALAGPTLSIQLDTFEIGGIVTSSGGSDRFLNTNTTYAWTVSITGDGGYGTQSASANMLIASGGAPRIGSTAIDISSLDDLVAGENYTISVGVRLVSGDQTYMALNDITLNGNTIIPEPASLMLLGLGSITLLRRR